MTDEERLREAVRHEWSEAERLEAWARWHKKFAAQSQAATEAIVEAARLRPGMRVLDLASGSGEPAISIARAVGLAGRVIATDLIPGMLQTLDRNARQEGLTNLSVQQADAESLPFAGSGFDAVTCRFGVMFFASIGRALREMHRVLKPGGRIVLAAWGPREQNPIFLTTGAILARYVDLPQPGGGTPDAYRFAEPGSLSRELCAAGFREVSEEPRTIPWPWPGPPEEVWQAHVERRGSQISRVLEKMPSELLARVTAEILGAIREYSDGTQVNFTATIVLACGIR